MQLRSFKSPEPIGKVGRQVLSAFFQLPSFHTLTTLTTRSSWIRVEVSSWFLQLLIHLLDRQICATPRTSNWSFLTCYLVKERSFQAPRCMCTAQYNGRGLHRLCQPWCLQSLTLKSICLESVIRLFQTHIDQFIQLFVSCCKTWETISLKRRMKIGFVRSNEMVIRFGQPPSNTENWVVKKSVVTSHERANNPFMIIQATSNSSQSHRILRSHPQVFGADQLLNIQI